MKVAAIQPLVGRYFSDSFHHYHALNHPTVVQMNPMIPVTVIMNPVNLRRRHGHSSRQGLAEAMDEMNAFLVSISAVAERWQMEEEEKQLRRSKQSKGI